MNLSDAGESRIRGYLYVLDSSLRTFLRRDIAADAVREVESHIRERVRETLAMPNERDALNRLLDDLGPPHRLARAYSAEMAVDEAVTTGRLLAILRAIASLAITTTEGFLAGLALFVGYTTAAAALIVAIAKPIFPNNVGIVTVNGQFRSAGLEFALPPNAVVTHGWSVAAVCAVLGTVLLVITHRAARAYLRHVRRRRKGQTSLSMPTPQPD
jgi:uncharacterized membrane protein